MATRRRTKAEIEAAAAMRNAEIALSNIAETTDDPADAGEDDAMDELRSLDAQGGLKYTVNKIGGTKPGERGGYCGTYQSGDLSLDVIREQHGAGKYRIRATDNLGKYVGNKTVDIAEVIKAQAVSPVAAAVPAAPDMHGLAEIIAALKPAPADHGNDLAGIMAMMTAMMKANTDTIVALIQKPQPVVPAGPSLTELLAIMNASKGDKDSTTVLMEGLRLGRELSGGGGETGWMDLASKGLEAVGPLLAGAREQQAQQAANPARIQQPRPTIALPAPQAQQTPAAPVGEQDMGMLDTVRQINWLKQTTASLIGHASRGKNPELYAEVTLDNLPPFLTMDQVYQRMQDTTAVQQLVALDARVANYAAWFEEFREAVIDLIDEARNPEGAPDENADSGEVHGDVTDSGEGP